MFHSLGIAGFRSYHPKELQQISFSKPLTLIWGENGSGKTTIIQALKYVSIGVMPPSCDYGKNFLTDPRLLGQSEVKGEIRLKFHAYTGRMVLAVRRALLTLTQKTCKFQSVQQILKTKDQNGNMLEINHHCAQIEKQIPILLGTSKAVLDKIVLCHQQQSLWPFEDSATLKNIFDELFQTKKYTQLIDALWQQRKELRKMIAEIKKALPFMERIYMEDKRKKFETLEEMQAVNMEARKLQPLKQKLDAMEAELGSGKEQAKMDLKFKLGKDRSSLKGNLDLFKYQISQALQKCESLKAKYRQLTGAAIQRRSDYSVSDCQQKLKELIDERQGLYQQQQKLRAVQVMSQKDLQIAGEVANAKEFLPELQSVKREDLTQQLVSAKLSQKVQFLQAKRKQLSTLKAELPKFSSSTLVLDKIMSRNQYQQQKVKLASNIKLLEQTKVKILSCYFALFKKIDQSASHCSKEGDVSVKLQEVQYRIKIKRQELEGYEKMPKGPSIKEKIQKLKFSGIQFYEQYGQYCHMYQKCSLCSKLMTPEELSTISAKCQKIKQKSCEQIQILQQEYLRIYTLHECNAELEVIILNLKSELAVLEARKQVLAENLQSYTVAMKWKEQRKINQRLLQGIRTVKFQRQVQMESAKKYQKYAIEASLELFSDSARKYIDFSTLVAKQKRQIEIYQQQKVRNVQKYQQNERNKVKSKQIIEEIQQIEQQTKYYEVIARIAAKLAFLVSEKQRLGNQTGRFSQGHPRNLDSIADQLESLQKPIRVLQIQKEYHCISAKIDLFQEQNLEISSKIQSIDSQISSIDEFMRQKKEKAKEYSGLKVQLQKKQHEIFLRRDLALLQYKRGSQEEYSKQVAKLDIYEKNLRDIEKYCGCVEATISKLHHEKMDEVNKVIFDIWKSVYQGKDIPRIQIDASYDLDTRKRKNYKYSIMMQKQVEETVRFEMKGRCSMGQKVLASIVIRIALAEVFSNTASMLTLDEPTTNLDRTHIDHLTQELARLIEMNLYYRKFQLVIISHDLEFIGKLEKYTDHYYEVSRNDQKFSVIKKKALRGVSQLHQ